MLKNHVDSYWCLSQPPYSPAPDEKVKLRKALLTAYDDPVRVIQKTIAYVISKIAQTDYPDEWPELMTYLANKTISQSNPTPTLSLNSLWTLDIVCEDLKEEIGAGKVRLPPEVFTIIKTILNTAEKQSLKYVIPTLSISSSVIGTILNGEDAMPKKQKREEKKKKEEFYQFAVYLMGTCLKLLKQPHPSDGNFVVKRYALEVSHFLLRLFGFFTSLIFHHIY